MDFDTRYRKLNAAQKKAVDTIDGPLMVIAGPGTGKTELLSMRAANILRKTDTLAENILCLTFTDSGASAMRERLAEIIGPEAYKVAIHTFHSFGSEIISQYGEYFYHGADFRPASELSAYELLRSIFDSLDYSNPLAVRMNDEYTYLRDTLTTISELKKSGLTNEELLQVLDANELTLDEIEPAIAAIFSERISAKTADRLSPITQQLAASETASLPPGISPLANVLALSLAHAVDAAVEQASTKPITAWKNSYLEKDEAGNFVFKDRKRDRRLRAVSHLYYQYLMKMQESELYDFDDMVLRVVHALEVFPDLRFNLQEKYLYIMVDEFQDTNLAQSRILHNLASGPFAEEPNLMVVGDDDQAIYSFQGAEVGNIIDFRDRYENTRIVTLTDNYRSASPILEKARSVIIQGEARLERYMDEIDKTLTAHRPVRGSFVSLAEYSRKEDERRGIVSAVKRQIAAGVNPADIAVLARRHHELIELLPYFYQEDIAINYERRDNALEADVIQQLVLLARIVCHLADGRLVEADELLPRLLAHPAWQFEAEEVWKLSLAAYKNRAGWLEEMALQPAFQQLHAWLFEQSRQTLIQPAELLLDNLIGSGDESDSFSSPLYDYFFPEERQTGNPAEYLVYLEALRTIRAKLREYRPNQRLQLSDFIEFVELHQQLGSAISSVRVRSDAPSDAVNLMTAHKSKGLEFDHVYIMNAVDTAWGAGVRSRSRLISYPANLPLRPSGDTPDERLRLFFVAMTRARKSLTISYAESDEAGKPLLRASFLTASGWEAERQASVDDPRVVAEQLRTEWYHPLLALEKFDMKRLLAPQLESYKLSATHLTAFLDVPKGGPQNFLVNNLLRFPRGVAPQAAFGSAVHQALQRAHNHLKSTGKRKPVEDVLRDFERSLGDWHLPSDDLQAYLQRGNESLAKFLAAHYEDFSPDQLVELNFANQHSRLDDAVLTGAIDLVDANDKAKTMTITDYKTGKPASTWSGKTDWEKIKLHKFKQQLMFYKLLVEHSRDYSNFAVKRGVLQFVEPTASGKVISLDHEFDQQAMERFAALVKAVHAHIITLDLPDVADFSADYKGILAFEESLLA